jgi:hypothetical protein
MRQTLIAARTLSLLALPAYAQEKKEPSALKGDERKKFMSGCLKG